jgi:prevent-host-death family protein
MMKTMQLREAKAKFSALVEAAEKGETTIVTKHGRPAAKVVPIGEGREPEAEERPSFAEMLMAIPHPIPIRRNRSRARKVEF